MTPSVVAIVCAKNEAPRIARVLEVLVEHPKLTQVVVVDDGSDDDTALVADRAGADVLRLDVNVGKGRAMLEGVRATGSDFVLFIDADLEGLTAEHVEAILAPALSGDFDMVVGMQDYGPEWTKVTRELPLISGQRVVNRSLLEIAPESVFVGYGVEVRLNDHVYRSGGRTGTVVLEGVGDTLKWSKDPNQGVAKMLKMAVEVTQGMVMARRAALGAYPSQQAQEAPPPPSVEAECATTDCVLQKLSENIVRAAGPYARDELWTPEVQHRVGRIVGKHAARPLWFGATAGSLFMFGPAGAAVTVLAWFFASEDGD